MNKRMLMVATFLTLTGNVNAGEQMSLQSRDISEGKGIDNRHVLNGFGCSGENQSPQLTWSDVPPGTKSFAITAYDPDAPTGSGWWHWLAYDIGPNVRELQPGAGSESSTEFKQGRNDFGAHAYGGACPPAGQSHRYQFKVYALGIDKLPVDANSSAALIGYFIKSHALAEASITAAYER